MVATLSRRSATALAMAFWLARNASDLGFILLCSIVIVPALSVWWRPGLAGGPSRNRYEHIPVRFASAIHGLRDSREDHPPTPRHIMGVVVRMLILRAMFTCSETALVRSASAGSQTCPRRFRRVSRPAAGGRSGIR